MNIIKSLGDGIGTGAGFAWPTFSLIFSPLSIIFGSTVGVILGAVSVGLFLVVALPITYWSYKHNLKENEKIQIAIDEQEQKISELIFDYLLFILRKHLFNSKRKKINPDDSPILIDELKIKILKDIQQNQYPDEVITTLACLFDDKKSNHFLDKFLTQAINIYTAKKNNVKNNYNEFVNTFRSEKDQTIKDIKNVYKKSNWFKPKPSSVFSQVKTGMIAFTAGFGSIAGCSAGVLGLLGSLGVFAGLAATPIVGWIILSAAIVFGLIVTGICIYSANEKNKKRQMITHYQKVNHELEVKINIHKIDAAIDAQKELQNTNNLNDKIGKKRARSVDFICTNRSYSMWWDKANSSKPSNHIMPLSDPVKHKKMPVQ